MGDRDDEAQIVYYDLDDSARHVGNMLYSPDQLQKRRALAAKAKAKAKTTTSLHKAPRSAASERKPSASAILERPKELFRAERLDFDDDAGREDESEGENPFASLLHAAQRAPERRSASPPPRQVDSAASSIDRTRRRTSLPLSVETAHISGSARAPLRQTTPSPARKRPQAPQYEAANARPDRWATSAGSGATQKKRKVTNLRRQSLQRTPPTESRFRTSESPGNSSGPRLSDVLQRATLLSQQQQQQQQRSSSAVVSHYEVPSNNPPVQNDGIIDTEEQLRAEPFETQFFSPTKADSAQKRKPKADALMSKIRGDLGESVRKASRRTAREVTMLRSHSHSILNEHDQGLPGGKIQDRAFVVVCLSRLRTHPHFVLYDGRLHAHDVKNDERLLPGTLASTNATKPARIRIVFNPQVVNQLQFVPGVAVRIYAPFRFVRQHPAPGGGRDRWLLLGTTLCEVEDNNHKCG